MDNNKDEELSGEFVLKKEPENKGGGDSPSAHAAVSEETAEVAAALPQGKASFLSALCFYPKNIRFENQEKGEIIVLLIRRALVTNIPWFLTAILLIFLPVLVIATADLFAPFIDISARTGLVVLLFYYLAVFGFILVQFMFWYFNVGLVTSKRVVDLDLNGILYKDVSETRLNLIEDVSYNKVGSVRAVFDYGDITLQTAGTLVNFEFDRAPNPAKIVRIIADMIGRKDKYGNN